MSRFPVHRHPGTTMQSLTRSPWRQACHMQNLWTLCSCTGSTGSSTAGFSEAREVIRIGGRLETVVRQHSSSPSPSPSPSSPPSQSINHSHQHTRGSPPPAALVATVPVVQPMTDAQLEQLVNLILDSKSVVALTGAGCSTESGVPDYRGPAGAYTKHGFKPMTDQQFMSGPAERARYWARAFLGWHDFASASTSGAHEGLARLARNGYVSNIITQNVDRLHHKAGTPSQQMLELHGTTHEVRCLGCGVLCSRHDLQRTLADLNPAAAELAEQMKRGLHTTTSLPPPQPAAEDQSPGKAARPVQLIPVRRPDGDVELKDAGKGFVVPGCAQCGGVLKPEVIFFGANIPPARAQKSIDLASSADLLMVVGSSLMVYSAFRLVEACKRNGGRVVLVNVGPTRADAQADLKLEVLAGEAMMRLATHPALLLPRVTT